MENSNETLEVSVKPVLPGIVTPINQEKRKFEVIVKQGDPILIPPIQKTENNGLYFLSNLDMNPSILQTFYFFNANEKRDGEAIKVIKEALAKVLVDYYPVAGRLTTGPDGRLAVKCTDEGGVFVEAEANCSMEAFGDKDKPDSETLGKLVYNFPSVENVMEIPPLVAQVTTFKCGGVALGLSLRHQLFDGASAMDFVNSWGETARGLLLTVPPLLDRTILKARNPPRVDVPLDEHTDIKDISNYSNLYDQEEIVYNSFCFDAEKIKRLKIKAMEDGVINNCTTFEVLSAFVWKARFHALKLKPDQLTKLLFPIDGRSRFDPPLPKGYFGNAVILTGSLCSVGELCEKPLSFSVVVVQKAIKSITDSYMRSVVDYFELKKGWPSLTATLIISSWSRLSFQAVDFGWGEPLRYGPIALPNKEIVLFLPHGKERKGVTVFLCLPASAMITFHELMQV